MKRKRIISGMLTVMLSGSAIFFISCHGNSDYTKSSTESSTDTTASKAAGTDTSTASGRQMNVPKKKGKVTIGNTSGQGKSMTPGKDGVYDMTDVSPAYPGGHSAMEDYVNNNIEYPQAAIDNNSEGTADVQFVVDENGKVHDPKVIGKALSNGMDEAAEKVVSNMPSWTPGKVKGKNVKTRIVLPITFKLEE